MSAIDFVVRGDAGVTQRGSLSGSDGTSMVVSAGQDVSLNLTRGDILSYVRQGQALQVTLVDGTVLTIDGFFAADGTAAADLFISANGTLAQAELVAGEGNLLFAQYVDADSFGKWSPNDDLYFVRGSDVQLAGVVPADEADVGQLGGALLGGIAGLPALGAGAAALGGSLLLAGSGGSDGDDDVAGDNGGGEEPVEPEEPDTPVEPEEPDTPVVVVDPVDPPVVGFTSGTETSGHTFNDADHSDGVEIGGNGTPNTSGTVTIGDVTRDITTDENGDWTVTFDPDEVPGGERTEEVTVTLTNEGGSTSTTDTVVLDTIASVTIETETVEGNGEINFVEESDGFTLTGDVEAGSTVTVTFGGNTYDATVTGSSWSLSVDAGVIAQGEYDLAIDVNATDAFGNTASTSGTVRVDTVTSVTVDTTSVGGADGVVNAAEHPNGIELNGLAEAGATVVVTLGTVSHTVTATSAGTWSTVYSSGELPTGELTLPVTAVSTDLAGNQASASGNVTIDTEIDVTVTDNAGGADSVVNAVERGDTITLSGETDPNASVAVTFNGVAQTVTADGDGNWSADYAGSSIPQNAEGTADVSVVATDAAGNTATTATTIDYDTFVNRLGFTGGAIEGDDIINSAEASDGVTLTGVVEEGSSVVVTFGGVERTATVAANGNWTVTFSEADIIAAADGADLDGFTADINVQATDAAGNTAEINDTVQVDLVAPEALDVIAVTTSEAGVTSAQVEGVDSNSAFDQFVNGADASTSIQLLGSLGDTHVFESGDVVPDGSHLLVTQSDDAGNATSTLVVLQDTATLDLSSGALGGFNVAEINLETTNGVNLEITTEQLQALSADSNELVIHGDDNDSVTMADLAGVAASGTRDIDGQTYDVYDLGGDTSLVIDQEINLNPVV